MSDVISQQIAIINAATKQINDANAIIAQQSGVTPPTQGLTPVRKPTDVPDSEIFPFQDSLRAAFHDLYNPPACDNLPGYSSMKRELTFWMPPEASINAQAKFLEAAAAAGDPYLAFSSNPLNGNHDTGDFVVDQTQNGDPWSNYYQPTPYTPNAKK